jgi:hypothetical protein
LEFLTILCIYRAIAIAIANAEDAELELICILFPVTETVIFVPAVIPTVPVNPETEFTKFTGKTDSTYPLTAFAVGILMLDPEIIAPLAPVIPAPIQTGAEAPLPIQKVLFVELKTGSANVNPDAVVGF